MKYKTLLKTLQKMTPEQLNQDVLVFMTENGEMAKPVLGGYKQTATCAPSFDVQLEAEKHPKQKILIVDSYINFGPY